MPTRAAVRRRAGALVPLALLACLLAAAALAGGCDGGGGGEVEAVELDRPHVVLILLDALHAEHVSHLGNPRETTPNLDALAADGITFTQAVAPAPYTLATVSSILTGRQPARHGLVDKRATLLPDEVTLAEVLRDAGYRTLAAVGNLNGSSIFGCDQGFEEYVEVFRPEDGRSVDVRHGDEAFHLARAADYPPIVERFLATHDDDRPLFLYLHVLEPHEPYAPPSPHRERWLDPEYDGPYAAGDSASLVKGRKRQQPFTPEDRAAVEALYDANLAHVDEVVGVMLDQLDAAGVLEDALVIVTSDHGEAFWQHGEQGHNTTLYEEMLHVPLIVRLPEGHEPRGVRSDALVSPMDVLPTVCDWLDLPLPRATLDGVSLDEPLARGGAPDRTLFLRTNHAFPHLGLRTPTEKVVVLREPGRVEPVRVERYRLDRDPDERRDLLAEDPDVARAAAERVLRWNAERSDTRARRGLELSPAEREMLRRLGYTE